GAQRLSASTNESRIAAWLYCCLSGVLNAFRHQRMNHCQRRKSLRHSRLHGVFSCISPQFSTGCIPALHFKVQLVILT
ncbi:MAG: hypothetical protein DWI22_07565, partial [Planctomycetota bacterium]